MKSKMPLLQWSIVSFALFSLIFLSQNSFAQVVMPEAITISPADASVTDTLTLTLDIRKGCTSEKSLPITGQEIIYMSGCPVRNWDEKTQWWSGGIPHPEPGRDGTPSSMTYNGDSTYSIRFKPSASGGVLVFDSSPFV